MSAVARLHPHDTTTSVHSRPDEGAHSLGQESWRVWRPSDNLVPNRYKPRAKARPRRTCPEPPLASRRPCSSTHACSQTAYQDPYPLPGIGQAHASSAVLTPEATGASSGTPYPFVRPPSRPASCAPPTCSRAPSPHGRPNPAGHSKRRGHPKESAGSHLHPVR